MVMSGNLKQDSPEPIIQEIAFPSLTKSKDRIAHQQSSALLDQANSLVLAKKYKTMYRKQSDHTLAKRGGLTFGQPK